MPARLQLVARTGHPDFLDLPWERPLEEWESRAARRGRARHPPPRRALRRVQRRHLRAQGAAAATSRARSTGSCARLAADEMPVVEAVGVVTERGDDLEAVLITRHLDYSLPFRTLFARGGVPNLRVRLLDAGAELLVRLHLGGFFWGDCSLSNTLFRRDAGALAAYLVDAETGELQPSLSRRPARGTTSRSPRRTSLGELLDLEAELDAAGRARRRGDGRGARRALRVALGRAHRARRSSARRAATSSTSACTV